MIHTVYTFRYTKYRYIYKQPLIRLANFNLH